MVLNARSFTNFLNEDTAWGVDSGVVHTYLAQAPIDKGNCLQRDPSVIHKMVHLNFILRISMPSGNELITFN